MQVNSQIRGVFHSPIPGVVLVCLAWFCAHFSAVVAEAAGSCPSDSPHNGLVASANSEPATHTAWWPFSRRRERPIYDSYPSPVTPHPAVARIIVPERRATAFGSGTLIDVREQYGLVVTNWHVVRDSTGVVEVVFPCGFRSHARPLKVDSDWDLAALVIWRPPIEPVKLASEAPRPGDLLTIHGYGQGRYRIATGRCTQYYAPRRHFPLEMVELNVEARQGDSGGPILNERGELAGVLFGAGEGTTLGSFAPRVSNFLATLAPDIGEANEQALVSVENRPAPNVRPAISAGLSKTTPTYPSSPWFPTGIQAAPAAQRPPSNTGNPQGQLAHAAAVPLGNAVESLRWKDLAGNGWYDPLKTVLALVGLATIAIRLVKKVR